MLLIQNCQSKIFPFFSDVKGTTENIMTGWVFVPAPGPSFGSRPWVRPPVLTPTLASNLYLPVLVPDLYLLDLAPNLRLPILAPNLYLPTLVFNIITGLEPEFCIYRACLLNLCLYLRRWPTIDIYLLIGSSSSGSFNSSSSSNFFGIDNTNICMPILVN